MKEQPATAFPLSWPVERPRTSLRTRSKFKVQSFARVRDELLNELALMRAKQIILSTNLKLRQDGLPLAGQAQPSDPGVAIYFHYKGKQVCFACDRWDRIEDNIQAVRHTINALRGITRWGTGDMVDAAFTGFAALPAPDPPWWFTLGVDRTASLAECETAYRRKARENHPDQGGTHEAMTRINAAIEKARKEKE